METPTERRYVYFVSVHFDLQGSRGVTRGTRNGETITALPITSSEAVVAAGGRLVDAVAAANPSWDRAYPGWRGTAFVLGCSLLRIEVWRGGEWVLADWQPWGPANVG